MKKTKLYNMDKDEWREANFKFGSVWRSDTVHQCEICHTKTNQWVMGGYLSIGPRLLCPGRKYQEHDELEQSLSQYETLGEQIRNYEEILKNAPNVNKERAENMLDNLRVQRELWEANISRLREAFNGRLDDVEGLGDDAPIRRFHPITSYGGDKKSLTDRCE